MGHMSIPDALETVVSAPPGTVVVRPSAIHGVGCFALEPVGAGEYIAEYCGQRIAEAEALRRDDASYARYSPYIVHLTGRRFIDGAIGGNEIRFINHSCNPNCDLALDDNRVFVAAARPIDKCEELTVDYAFDRGAGFHCNCRALECRGTPYSVNQGEQ
jgi:SET domain-containing protein